MTYHCAAFVLVATANLPKKQTNYLRTSMVAVHQDESYSLMQAAYGDLRQSHQELAPANGSGCEATFGVGPTDPNYSLPVRTFPLHRWVQFYKTPIIQEIRIQNKT